MCYKIFIYMSNDISSSYMIVLYISTRIEKEVVLGFLIGLSKGNNFLLQVGEEL